jgi:hypothetical protein
MRHAATTINLKASELVEVRSKEEILATLDQNGCLDGLPFMPEMFVYCGRRLRVYKRAHKTCDTINFTGGRRMSNAVHLANIRCDGQAHGGCQAECLIFWKEAWLKRICDDSRAGGRGASPAMDVADAANAPAVRCTEGDVLTKASRTDGNAGGETVYFCQATQLLQASTPLPPSDWRQYWEDYSSGNVGLKRMLGVVVYANCTALIRRLRPGNAIRRLVYWMYSGTQMVRRKPRRHPRTAGRIAAGSPTPAVDLNLQPGELVRVKSFDAILNTIDHDYYNRGMRWDAEMVPYCGGTYRVHQRVQQIIDEKTGKMRNLKNPCIILEGVVCQAIYSECRWFCPRSIYSYWREIWLERVTPTPEAARSRVDKSVDPAKP